MLDAVVDVVTVLAAPLAGLAGVLVGGHVQGRREDRRLEFESERDGARLRHEYEVARDARLFEHRRAAYIEFIDWYLDHYNRVYVWAFEKGPDPGYDELTWAELWRLHVRISIYGRGETNHLAGDVMEYLAQMYDMTHVPHIGRDQLSILNRRLGDVYGKFIDEVQRDLGANFHPTVERMESPPAVLPPGAGLLSGVSERP